MPILTTCMQSPVRLRELSTSPTSVIQSYERILPNIKRIHHHLVVHSVDIHATQRYRLGTIPEHRVQQVPPIPQVGLQPVLRERGHRRVVPRAAHELVAQAAAPPVLRPRIRRRGPPWRDVVVHEAAARRSEPPGIYVYSIEQNFVLFISCFGCVAHIFCLDRFCIVLGSRVHWLCCADFLSRSLPYIIRFACPLVVSLRFSVSVASV